LFFPVALPSNPPAWSAFEVVNPATGKQRKGGDTVMQSVLALAELAAEVETQGFQEVNVLGFTITSGNSDDSNNCGSNASEGC
jgi:hypothetical protein